MRAPLGTLTRCLVSHASINWMRMKFDMMMCNLQAVKVGWWLLAAISTLDFEDWTLHFYKTKVVRCSPFKKISLVICGFSSLLLHLHYVHYNFVLWMGLQAPSLPNTRTSKSKELTWLHLLWHVTLRTIGVFGFQKNVLPFRQYNLGDW